MRVNRITTIWRKDPNTIKTAWEAVGKNLPATHVEDLNSLGIFTARPDTVGEEISIMEIRRNSSLDRDSLAGSATAEDVSRISNDGNLLAYGIRSGGEDPKLLRSST